MLPASPASSSACSSSSRDGELTGRLLNGSLAAPTRPSLAVAQNAATACLRASAGWRPRSSCLFQIPLPPPATAMVDDEFRREALGLFPTPHTGNTVQSRNVPAFRVEVQKYHQPTDSARAALPPGLHHVFSCCRTESSRLARCTTSVLESKASERSCAPWPPRWHSRRPG